MSSYQTILGEILWTIDNTSTWNTTTSLVSAKLKLSGLCMWRYTANKTNVTNGTQVKFKNYFTASTNTSVAITRSRVFEFDLISSDAMLSLPLAYIRLSNVE